MKIAWTINIKDENYSPYNHNLKPVIWRDKLFYVFETLDKTTIDESGFYGTKICVLEINLKDRKTKHKEFLFSYNQLKLNLSASKKWKFITTENSLKLDTGVVLVISKDNIQLTNEPTTLEEFSIKSEYQFGNKIIRYNQRSKLTCFDISSRKLIWERTIKAYIYTKIEQKENLLFFGTAGKGGAFYCLNLDDGKILAEYNNGDASDFSWHKDNIIIKDKKGNLVKINSQNGETIEELKLKDKISFYAPILINDDQIFVRTDNKKELTPKLICVEM